MNVTRMRCVDPGCPWQFTAVESPEMGPAEDQVRDAFLAHVEVEHSDVPDNQPDPWRDDPLYRELCPYRPTPPAAGCNRKGPTVELMRQEAAASGRFLEFDTRFRSEDVA